MRPSFLLALALASSTATAASAADLRIPPRLATGRPPVTMECTSNGTGTVSCMPAIVLPPHKIGSPIGKGSLQ